MQGDNDDDDDDEFFEAAQVDRISLLEHELAVSQLIVRQQREEITRLEETALKSDTRFAELESCRDNWQAELETELQKIAQRVHSLEELFSLGSFRVLFGQTRRGCVTEPHYMLLFESHDRTVTLLMEPSQRDGFAIDSRFKFGSDVCEEWTKLHVFGFHAEWRLRCRVCLPQRMTVSWRCGWIINR